MNRHQFVCFSPWPRRPKQRCCFQHRYFEPRFCPRHLGGPQEGNRWSTRWREHSNPVLHCKANHHKVRSIVSTR
ncbi:hypothetical protein M758_UG309100 [Ceratodon purpureus]|nr:hypothetical protein M758_UG309100 [Ceratodon purpureus]